jgi:hypothetical protein
MVISISKTKEIVFHHPFPCLTVDITPVRDVEQINEIKLLCVVFSDIRHFDSNVSFILKCFSQWLYIIRRLSDQGLSIKQLTTGFDAIILLRILYASLA